MVKKVLFLFLLVISATKGYSISKDSTKKLSFFPFPIVSYTPETNVLLGTGCSFTFRFKNEPAKAKPSNVFVGAAYTFNEQMLFYSLFKVFYDTNKYYLFGEAGFFRFNYFYYGIGENEVPEELIDVDFPRIQINAHRKVLPHFYLGVRYQYENYQIKNLKPDGELIKGTVPGGMGSVVSGAGISIVYDSRDSVFYPNKGVYGEISYTNYAKFWGANHTYNRYIVDVSTYKRVHPKVILAFNSYNSFAVGNVPFQQLSAIGGNKKMRGYYRGRYRDENVMMLQAESRIHIWKRVGAAVFGSIGALGGKPDFLRMSDPKYTYGAGLRIAIAKKDHLNLRVDYGLGPNTNGVYFTIGEAF